MCFLLKPDKQNESNPKWIDIVLDHWDVEGFNLASDFGHSTSTWICHTLMMKNFHFHLRVTRVTGDEEEKLREWKRRVVFRIKSNFHQLVSEKIIFYECVGIFFQKVFPSRRGRSENHAPSPSIFLIIKKRKTDEKRAELHEEVLLWVFKTITQVFQHPFASLFLIKIGFFTTKIFN